MAFWGRERWLKQGKLGYGKCPVLPWNEKCVEAAGYRLSVGSEVYINGDSSKSVRKLNKGEGFVIQPGQFAFILTDEKVYISNGAIGFISIRATIKFMGLVNVSGFQVNPGFSGNLVFAVFNAGPKHVNLRQGDEAFSLWIADLDSATVGDFETGGKVPNNLDRIPTDIVNGIAGNSLTAYQLSERFDDLKKELSGIRTTFNYIQMVAIFAVAVVLAVFREPLYNAFASVSQAPILEESVVVPKLPAN